MNTIKTPEKLVQELGEKDHVRLHLKQTKVTNMKMYIDVQLRQLGPLIHFHLCE